tara:strand:- start:249 stop:1043 length:795 start_codon:yes stop_codon:yes gene_type:complete
MKKPLVSILIACYNREKYIDRCIRSCLDQTYKNIEIVFIDDSSTDKSYKIAKKFNKVKVYKKKRKNFKSKFGTFYLLDTYIYAYKKSKGKILSFLDADDFFNENKIKNIVDYFNKNTQKKIIFDKPIIYYSKKDYIYSKDYENLPRRKKWPKFPPTSCISIKKNFFSKIKNELKPKNFDLLSMDFRLAVISKFIFKDFKILNKHLTFYFQNKKGEINSNFKKFRKNWWLRRMQAHEYMKYLFKKNNLKYTNLDYTLTKIINLIF